MDAVLGKDCVNDVCSVLKSQTAAEAAACTKQTQVLNEVIGRNGECELTIPSCVKPGSC